MVSCLLPGQECQPNVDTQLPLLSHSAPLRQSCRCKLLALCCLLSMWCILGLVCSGGLEDRLNRRRPKLERPAGAAAGCGRSAAGPFPGAAGRLQTVMCRQSTRNPNLSCVAMPHRLGQQLSFSGQAGSVPGRADGQRTCQSFFPGVLRHRCAGAAKVLVYFVVWEGFTVWALAQTHLWGSQAAPMTRSRSHVLGLGSCAPSPRPPCQLVAITVPCSCFSAGPSLQTR